ncbi:MAG: carboxypeptidase regulatory-like domain-containing protein [Salinivirgaceae bacterium]|jgi:hypothetical protein|nr:T9SS type A sorting domain-containing protein [Bacteroidales bacterium]
MIKKLTFLTAVMFVCLGVLSQHAIAQQGDASKEPIVVTMHTGTVTTCDALFYDSGGPTGQYGNGETFTLTFLPETPGSRIKVTFLEFDTENLWDKLYVYNGTSSNAPLIATLMGTTIPAEPFIGENSDGALTFFFQSDPTSGTRDGWKATVECYTPMLNNLVAVGLNTSPNATASEPKTVPFVIFNQGGANITGAQYTVQLKDAADNVLATANGIDIISGAQTSVDLIWTPTTTGPIDVKGVIVFAEDQNPDDNTSPLVTITVHPAGTYVATVGPGATVTGMRFPFDMYWKNNYAQTIYTNEQLGIGGGTINSIVYKYNFVSADVGTKGVKVWMGETTLSNLDDGFIDPNTFTLVYDGDIDFFIGINHVIINLQTPYVYTGGNLVIHTYRNLDTQEHSYQDLFYMVATDENHTRHRQSNSPLDPLAPSGGTARKYVPEIAVHFNTSGLGTILGNVTCEGAPAEGVTVKLVDEERQTTTNASGNYTFKYLTPGIYKLEFTKFGYSDALEENINVIGDSTITINTTINPLPQITVSGTVKASDTNQPLDSVVVHLKGYVNYTDTTNAGGQYSITGVWGGGKVYEITTEEVGNYQAYSETITVNDANVTHNIVVEEFAFPAGKVTATIEGENVKVNWLPPDGTLMGDPRWITWCGEPDPTNGIGAGLNPFTCAHRFTPEQLETLEVVGMSVTKVRFFPRGAGTYKVQVWTGGSATDPGTLAHEQFAANVTLLQWNEVELTTPVVISEGQELWYGIYIVPTETYAGGVDAGPAVTGFGDMAKIAEQEWKTLSSVGLSYNWALGAYVDNGKGFVTELSMLYAEYEMNATKRENYEYGKASPEDLRFTCNHNSEQTAVAKSSANRVFVDYAVYRLVKNQPQSEWTQLIASTSDTVYTDTGWETLPAALYQYAVVAKYTNNIESQPRLSNILAKDMEAEYTVNVTSTADEPIAGALVTLTNHDGNEFHVYVATTETTGGVTFPAVWKGVYSITVTKDGYLPFAEDNVVIDADATYPIELYEIIIAPYGLLVTQDGNDDIFTWNNQIGFSDDIESYEDFIVQNIGDYILVDVDNSDTYGISNTIFPGAGTPFAYIVFNPTATSPAISDENWAAHSGNKFLGSFAATVPPNNDWLITPEFTTVPGMEFSFWAKTVIPDYGLEQFKVGVSTGGTAPNDFTIISEGSYVEAPANAWTKFTYPLDTYVGQNIRLAINCVSDDRFVFMVDDISLGVPGGKTRAFSGYTVYLDGVEQESGIVDSTYIFENVSVGTHTAGVKAVYTSGSSEIIETPFVHESPIYNVKFIVTRAINGNPILQANVAVSSGTINESALTDINGIATFQLPGGNYNWTVTKESFETMQGEAVIVDHTEIPVSMTGVGDNATIQGIMLYPNPATSTLTITRKNNSKAIVEIYSNNGAIVNSFEINEVVKEISVSELNSGVYFIRLIEKETTTVQRFIKQ